VLPVVASLTDPLVQFAVDVVDKLGLPGVFVLMVAESACIPIPSEGTMLFAGFNVSGALIEVVAARLLGDRSAPPETDRPPSPIAMTLFNQAGKGLVAALIDAWRDEQARKVTALGTGEPPDAWRRAISDEENVILVTLQLDSPSGLILLVARPPDLAPRAPQLPHVDSERNPDAESQGCRQGASCATNWIEELGYVTIPTLAGTAFATIIVLLLFARSRLPREHSPPTA
jgi:hypothetical protein